MKKVIALLVLLVVVSVNVSSQSYRINKTKYDPRLYTPQFDDPYSPALSGVASFFIPGLGQMVSGEVGRGIGFLAGSLGCVVLTSVGSVTMISSSTYYGDFNYGGAFLFFAGFIGMITVDIWAIVDAVRVAKVNNMYIQDLRNSPKISLELSPYFEPGSYQLATGNSVGLTLRARF